MLNILVESHWCWTYLRCLDIMTFILIFVMCSMLCDLLIISVWFFTRSKSLPSIEEAWSLPIPAELTSRQGVNMQQVCLPMPAESTSRQGVNMQQVCLPMPAESTLRQGVNMQQVCLPIPAESTSRQGVNMQQVFIMTSLVCLKYGCVLYWCQFASFSCMFNIK